MILQYITWDVKPQLFDLGSFEIRWYSLLFATGFILGYFILAKIFKREGLSIELLDKLTIYVVLSTIIGARLGHCLFYEPEYYLQNPMRMILPWEGKIGEDFRFTGYQGLASHGGAIGILIGLYIYARNVKKPYLWVLDRMVIATALAACFIRLGNLMNSEIVGVQTNLPWGFKFMRETLYGIPPEEVVPKHPAQLYEAVAYLASFFVLRHLYFNRLNRLQPGFLLGLFLILIFASRFFIEFLKEPQVEFETAMALNMGQILSIPFVLAGVVLLILAGRKEKKENSG